MDWAASWGRGGGEFGPGHLSLVAEGPLLQTLGWNYTFGLDARLAALISTPGDLTRELGVIRGVDHDMTRWAPPQREP